MLWKWRRKLREPCEGPWCLVMPRRSLSFRASPGGLPVPVGCHVLSCLFSPGGLSCPVCLCLAPEGSWYPLTSPGKFFGGVEGVPAIAGYRWAKSICHGLLSSLHRHGLLSSQLRHGPCLSVPLWRSPSCVPVRVCPEGPPERPPPLPGGTVTAWVTPFGRGE